MANGGNRERKERRKEIFNITMHSTDFIYDYMMSNIYGIGPLR